MSDKTQPAGRVRLLIVEDHKQLAENLFEYLGEQRYELDYAADGLTALHLLAHNAYDVIILDIMLPGVDGLSICQRVRQDLNSNVPIIMLTARDSIDDKTLGFHSGADDYLVKPFHMRELELRIQALCRRRHSDSNRLSAGQVHYDPGTLKASIDGAGEVLLSGYGATIFETLMRHYPRFVSYQTLSESLWGNADGDPNTLRTHVYSLRKVLKTGLGRELIRTLHGRGYCLTDE
ncbi:response regulator transcription factor [Pseudomaricurvus alcaniphilus]|uniref:response regulator transcription factor n=1 Tax=Pseudomaricurvus alcaniphilus TaxID=1166482 RepID=UPI0014078E73|nr:response regulator transcription factor [Pseudomaricurvus alcaniphilus]NHN38507.1 response regulator transcription factor [Pseudomaricurvus alcaniphilus]